jgi:hypothetical protein
VSPIARQKNRKSFIEVFFGALLARNNARAGCIHYHGLSALKFLTLGRRDPVGSKNDSFSAKIIRNRFVPLADYDNAGLFEPLKGNRIMYKRTVGIDWPQRCFKQGFFGCLHGAPDAHAVAHDVSTNNLDYTVHG